MNAIVHRFGGKFPLALETVGDKKKKKKKRIERCGVIFLVTRNATVLIVFMLFL